MMPPSGCHHILLFLLMLSFSPVSGTHIESHTFITSPNQHPHQHPHPHQQQSQIVFIGDSLMRYQYLTYLYNLHFQSLNGSEAVIKRVSESWGGYFARSSGIFQGHMKCDAARPRSLRENRYYKHPSLNISASFFFMPGDRNMCIVRKKKIVQYTMKSFLNAVVAKLIPSPTMLILNAGHWEHANITKDLPSILQQAQTVLSPVTTSAGSTTNITNATSTSKTHKSSAAVRYSDPEVGCLVWLETPITKRNLYDHQMPSDRRILNESLCLLVNNTYDNATTTANTGADAHQGSGHIDSRSARQHIDQRGDAEGGSGARDCLYVPFSLAWLPPMDELKFTANDNIHFTNMEIYHKRNLAAFDACHSVPANQHV